MAFIEAVEDRPTSGPVAEHFAEDEAGWGYIPNFARTFCLRPEVYSAWKQLNGAIKAAMEPRRYELVTVAAAATLRSSYCSLAHGRILARKFMPAEDVIQLIDDTSQAGLDPAEQAIVSFAEKVVLGADRITEDDVNALRAQGLTDGEVFDVTLAAAARCFFSKTLDATGTQPDPSFEGLEPRLREALTVGRPIEGLPEGTNRRSAGFENA